MPRGINDHDFSDNRLNIGQTGVSRTIGDPLKIKSSQQRAGEIKDCLKSLNDETVRKWNRTFTRTFLVYTIAVASTHGNDSFVYKYTRNYFTKPFQKNNKHSNHENLLLAQKLYQIIREMAINFNLKNKFAK